MFDGYVKAMIANGADIVIGELGLQLFVQVQRAIEETAAGTTGAIFLYCGYCGLLEAGVVRQSQI